VTGAAAIIATITAAIAECADQLRCDLIGLNMLSLVIYATVQEQ
jgi:hypothetical protein